MTEPQEIVDDASAAESAAPVDEEARPTASTIEVDGRVWTVVGLADGESWDLYAGANEDRGQRLAHVTITDEGYFSTDAGGTVRGPYVTLSEATYPLGLNDPLLLGDVAEPTPAQGVPSAPSATPVPPADRRSWVRTVGLIGMAVVFTLLVQRVIRARSRPVRSPGAGSGEGRR